MNEEDLEELITLDDPGEDTLEEDTFHQPDDSGTHRSAQTADVAANKKK